MTTLSQYMHAEKPDYAEPASFYVPGADTWSETAHDVHRMRQFGGRRPEHTDLVDTLEAGN